MNIPEHNLYGWFGWQTNAQISSWQTGVNSGYLAFTIFGKDKFIGSGNNGSLKYSEDGITWTDVTSGVSKDLYALAYGNGKYIAAGYNSNIALYSEDGINWNKANDLPESKYWYSATYGAGKFVVVPTGGANTFAYSEDGINWNTGSFPTSNVYNFMDISYCGNKFFAVPDGNAIYFYSEDGINWTEKSISLDGGSPSNFVYGNGKYIVMGYKCVVYSEDGINWNKISLTDNISGKYIVYGNGIFIALANNAANGDTNYYLYSYDGITWKYDRLPTNYSSNAYTLCYGKEKFIYSWNNISYYLTTTKEECYTNILPAVTNSEIYSAPNVKSDLTVTSVEENSLILSDNKTYIRNPNLDKN